MSDLEEFEVVFGRNEHIAYERGAVAEIRKRRKDLEGELFIDRLLKALGLQDRNHSDSLLSWTINLLNRLLASNIYPPASHAAMRELHHQISYSSSPSHHKHSVLYYIVKDVPQRKSRLQEKFLDISYLPAKYKIFVDGIWSLDHLELEVSGPEATFAKVKLADETSRLESFGMFDAACIDTDLPR